MSNGGPRRRQRLRLAPVAAALLALAACVHLPDAVRSELRCDPAQSNQYGGARACTGAR